MSLTAPLRWLEAFTLADLRRIADETTDQAVRVDVLAEILLRERNAR